MPETIWCCALLLTKTLLLSVVKPSTPINTHNMGSQEQQQQQQLALEDPCGPSVWEAAAAHKGDITAESWEYQMRKALNDAAYNNLAYEPYCPHMPTHHKDCPHPVFTWVRSYFLLREMYSSHSVARHACYVY
jgi:hypothetical protein